MSPLELARQVAMKEGPAGFYRGFWPPFLGATLYRSAQFSVFEAFYTLWKDNKTLCQSIPYTGGLEWRTLVAGFLGGSARALIECPVDYIKVKR